MHTIDLIRKKLTMNSPTRSCN